jgi:hypothetical protein
MSQNSIKMTMRLNKEGIPVGNYSTSSKLSMKKNYLIKMPAGGEFFVRLPYHFVHFIIYLIYVHSHTVLFIVRAVNKEQKIF